jgi:transposase
LAQELYQIEEPRPDTASTLVPVIVSEAAPAGQAAGSEEPAPSQPRRKRSDVMIELGRGRRVRVDSDIDTVALGRILDCVLDRR